MILYYQGCVVSRCAGELPAVSTVDKLSVQERKGNAVTEAEIPGFEVQGTGSSIIFVIVVRFL